MRKVTLEQQSRDIEARKIVLGVTMDVRRLVNSGARRTPSKRALLRLLRDLARKERRALPFDARI